MRSLFNHRGMSADKTELLDHIGWRLHQAASLWHGQFRQRMVARGYPVFAEARSALIPLITRSGVPQSGLADRAGISKQAVQQHLDALVADGLVERVGAPEDARRRLVRFTDRGSEMLAVGNATKQEIEYELADRIGAANLEALKSILEAASRHFVK